MSVLAIALAVATLQVQAGPAARDSFAITSRAVTSIAAYVAQVRSALEVYRRAVYNEPDAEVVRTAQLLRQRCRTLGDSTPVAARSVCRSCTRAGVQQGIDRYRAGLPETARVGARCAGVLDRLLRAASPAERLRARFRGVSGPLVAGLTQYEGRLERLRAALGWVVPGPAPRRSR